VLLALLFSLRSKATIIIAIVLIVVLIWEDAINGYIIEMIAETTDYFVFLFSIRHVQIYDKKAFQVEFWNNSAALWRM